MARIPAGWTTGHSAIASSRWRSITYVLLTLCIATRTVAAQPPTTAIPAASVPRTVVYGIVYDSIARRGIPGATVDFVSAENVAAGVISAIADSSGRYSIGDLRPGKYLAGFFHPALDTLGLADIQRVVDIEGTRQRVDFATPSAMSVIRAVCGASEKPDSSGLLIGQIRGTENRLPVVGAMWVEWSEISIDASGIRQRSRQVSAPTGDLGRFAICGVPTDIALHARALSGSDSSGYVEVEVPPGGLRNLSFLVGGAALVSVNQADSTGTPDAATAQATRVWRGRARLTGTVHDHNGRPLSNAHALVWGTGLDVMTNERGAFVLDSLPGGTHTLEVRVIGYVPVRTTIQLAESRPATANVILDKSAAVLATVTVRGQLVYSRHLAEFERRRRAGFGRYLSSEDIAKRPASRLSGLLQGMPGVYVSLAGGRRGVSMRDARGGGYCTPTLYIDGMRDVSGDIDIYDADEIAGIEVYNRQGQRPMEFMDMSGCGAIVVWTRSRLPKPRKN